MSWTRATWFFWHRPLSPLARSAIGSPAVRRQKWRTLFLRRSGNQFLEARIFAQWLKHRIQPEQCRSERRVRGQRRLARDRKQPFSCGYGAIGITGRGRHPRQEVAPPRTRPREFV